MKKLLIIIKNRETILNRAKKHNEVLKERARNKYRELSEEEKKQNIREYRKK